MSTELPSVATTIGYQGNEGEKSFAVADYVVFGCLFLVSALIGIFFAIKDRKKKTSEDYLLAGRKMSGWPVSLSLTASFMSAITVLGAPAETYRYGTMYWWFAISYTLVALLTANLFVPVFYNMGISSTYEYLEHRFNRTVRVAGTCCFILQTVLYMGMVMYMPALALNKVTGVDLNLSIVVTAVVCTFYTTIGGMKAVVWNDVVQCCVMMVGFVAVLVKGSIDVGGLSEVFRIANEGGRIDFWHFDLDPRVRHSFWSVCVGGTLTWLSVYAVNQSMVQRYLSCKSLNQAKLALYINDLGLFIILCLASLTGLVMYAVYATCDPLSNGSVSKSDQLVPYLVLDLLSVFPGIPGIFVASAYSGTLSTISTGINALACSTYEDIIKPHFKLSGAKALLVSKILVLIYGLLALAVAYLASLMDRVLTMALKVFAMIGGPVLGMFCLGLFTPVGNSAGALVGLIVGLVTGIWLGVGSMLYPLAPQFERLLPVTTEGCLNTAVNFTAALNSSSAAVNATAMPANGLVDTFYALSYSHYPTLLVSLTWVIGLLVSLATGGLKSYRTVPSELLAYSGNVCCCLGTDGCSHRKKKSTYTSGKRQDDVLSDKFDDEL